MREQILSVEHLSVSFDTYAGEVQAVRDVSFTLEEGEIISIVGESGSGKSVMTQSLVKLLPAPPARIKGGQVNYKGRDLTGLNFQQLRSIKGEEIAYIFQDPMTSLNPTVKIGRQVVEGILAHAKVGKKEARRQAVELLREAGIPNPEKRMEQYPHELSGGMRQRVMIAIAIAMHPRLLVADEPTTALDVTIQAQILETLRELNQKLGMAIILITHNMGIVARMARRVMVMYGGKIVESGDVRTIFHAPGHPYTRSLLAAVPRLDAEGGQPLEYIVGAPPDMLLPPAGCPFAPRCKYAMEVCCREMPPAYTPEEGHSALCWLWDEGAAAIKAEFDAGRIPGGEEGHHGT